MFLETKLILIIFQDLQKKESSYFVRVWDVTSYSERWAQIASTWKQSNTEIILTTIKTREHNGVSFLAMLVVCLAG
jgi:hypothetical protein